jgi:hypothetical protein
MTKTSMKTMLRMAIFGGAVALAPALAMADTWTDPRDGSAQTKPDHETAEAHGDAEPSRTGPTHEEAQPASARAEPRPSGLDNVEGVPDHAEAQARGAQPSQ